MPDSQYNALCGNASAASPAPLPECCGTGCAVCVLDYPEQFLNPQSTDSNLLAMLTAFEEAEAAIATPDSET
jgi:hypothetical protein